MRRVRKLAALALLGLALNPAAAADSARITVEDLRRASAQLSTDPADAESRLQALLMALAAQRPDAALRREVETLATQAPRSFRRAEDHPRNAAIPVANVGAAARAVLAQWARAEQARAWIAAWRLDRRLALPQDPRLARLAVDALDPAERWGLLEAGDALPVEIAAAAARGLPHAPTTRRVLRTGRGPASLEHVAELSRLWPAASALAMLDQALSNPDLALAAARQLAQLASTQAQAREQLLARLSDPASGAAAAQALSTLADAETAARLESALQGPDDLRLRRALLALQLSDRPASRAALAAFAADPARPADLRREVAGWLP